jgi:hypothetical protein
LEKAVSKRTFEVIRESNKRKFSLKDDFIPMSQMQYFNDANLLINNIDYTKQCKASSGNSLHSLASLDRH